MMRLLPFHRSKKVENPKNGGSGIWVIVGLGGVGA